MFSFSKNQQARRRRAVDGDEVDGDEQDTSSIFEVETSSESRPDERRRRTCCLDQLRQELAQPSQDEALCPEEAQKPVVEPHDDVYDDIDDIDDFDAFEKDNGLNGPALTSMIHPEDWMVRPEPVDRQDAVPPHPPDMLADNDTIENCSALQIDPPLEGARAISFENAMLLNEKNDLLAPLNSKIALIDDDDRPGAAAKPQDNERPLSTAPEGGFLGKIALSGNPVTQPCAPTFAMPGQEADIKRRPLPQRQRRPNLAAISSDVVPTLMISEVPRLRRFAAAMIGDEGTADLLVQDTLQEALADPGEQAPGRDLNLSLLVLLYRLRREVLEQVTQPPRSILTAGFETVLFLRLQGADRDEIREFAYAIASLGEEDRALLLLTTLENLGYREVAAVLNVTAGRVMSKIARAREQLRLALQREAVDGKRSLSTGDQAGSKAAAKQVADIELHGYLDGELSDQRLEPVEDYLEQHRAAAERLVHFGVQGDLVRRLYGPLINRPMPAQMASRFQFISGKKSQSRPKGRRARVMIISLLMVSALGCALWFFLPAWL